MITSVWKKNNMKKVGFVHFSCTSWIWLRNVPDCTDLNQNFQKCYWRWRGMPLFMSFPVVFARCSCTKFGLKMHLFAHIWFKTFLMFLDMGRHALYIHPSWMCHSYNFPVSVRVLYVVVFVCFGQFPWVALWFWPHHSLMDGFCLALVHEWKIARTSLPCLDPWVFLLQVASGLAVPHS